MKTSKKGVPDEKENDQIIRKQWGADLRKSIPLLVLFYCLTLLPSCIVVHEGHHHHHHYWH